MTRLFATAAVVIAFTSASSANADCSHPDEANLVTHGCYTNKYGDEVHRPSKTIDGRPAVGFSAHCRDGSYSFSTHPEGDWTCSHHGGSVAGGKS
jgi:hypothetical protein